MATAIKHRRELIMYQSDVQPSYEPLPPVFNCKNRGNYFDILKG
ncbi:MAG: hypothetical protein ACKPCQ_20000 [Dolichospermum sp.]